MAFQVFLQIKAVSKQPPHNDMGFTGGVFTLGNAVALLYTDRRIHSLFIAHWQFDIQLVEPLESQLFEAFVVFMGRNVAVSGKNGVTWVVVMLIEADEVVIAQINNVIRLAATVVMIGRCREKVTAQILPEL